MAEPLVCDELWEIVEPLIPKHVPSPKGGTSPSGRPAGIDGNPVRAQKRHSLGNVAL